MYPLKQCFLLCFFHQTNQIKQRARIIGVGVTDAIDEDQLLEMVSNPDTDYFTVEDFDLLVDQLEDIITSVRPSVCVCMRACVCV